MNARVAISVVILVVMELSVSRVLQTLINMLPRCQIYSVMLTVLRINSSTFLTESVKPVQLTVQRVVVLLSVLLAQGLLLKDIYRHRVRPVLRTVEMDSSQN
jgi:hypothetical protein